MPRDVEEQVALGVQLVEQRLGLGDRVHQLRPIDHLAGFRTRKAAEAAGEELVAAGYRIDGLYRRFLTVWLEFSAMTAVDSAMAAAFTREVVGIVDRHGGTYDGWGGFLVGDDEAAPDA
ncbi:ribonuclease E inhibitor RraB [Blastococcus saxobsidens]|uniref:Ribonuclease E inhibitor RraB n=1 Tax=Blastococcus saxobsidens TaxID=138336 RepID=A0A6L9W4F6_9ACTN|nr:ribonuclease E inhibitor RraB [Blastococcus saxobsidens]